MSKKTKIILRYPKYQNIIDQYLSLDEFEEKAAETMRSKRVTVTAFCNYLGDQGIESINLCLQKHVVGFMENISSLSTSTKSGKTFILRHFFNFLYAQGLILYSGRELFPVIVTNKRDRILSFYSWCCIIKVDTLFSRILIYNHNQYENRRKTYGTESKIL